MGGEIEARKDHDELPKPIGQVDALEEGGLVRGTAVQDGGASEGNTTGASGGEAGDAALVCGSRLAVVQDEQGDLAGLAVARDEHSTHLQPSATNGVAEASYSNSVNGAASAELTLSIPTASATNGTTGSPPLSPLTPVPESSEDDVKPSKGKGRARSDSPASSSTKRRRTRSPPPFTLPLPPPPPFLINGGTSQDDPPLGANYRVWSEQEDAYLLTMRASGYTFDQIAEVVGRTSTAVSIRFYALKRRQKEHASQVKKEEMDVDEVSQFLLGSGASGYGGVGESSVWTIDGQPVLVGPLNGFGDPNGLSATPPLPLASNPAILPLPPAPSAAVLPPPLIVSPPVRKTSSIRHYTPEEDDLVCQYRQEGLSVAAIGKKLDRSTNSIYNRLTALASMGRDVKPRKKSRAKKEEGGEASAS
ncbi:hypothetical protein JCM10295v2_006835 [Rhodotorula toruloides]